MDKSRHSFQLRRGMSLGDRLIMRNPGQSRDARRLLEGLGETPSNITLGYFRRLTDPPGAVAFMPVPTPAAIAMLAVPSVQARICEDLAMLVGEAAAGADK